MKRCEDKLDEISVISGKSNNHPVSSDECVSLCGTEVSDTISINASPFASDSSSNHSRVKDKLSQSRLSTSQYMSGYPSSDTAAPERTPQAKLYDKDDVNPLLSYNQMNHSTSKPIVATSLLSGSMINSSHISDSLSQKPKEGSLDVLNAVLPESGEDHGDDKQIQIQKSASGIGKTSHPELITTSYISGSPSMISPEACHISDTVIPEHPFESDTEDDEEDGAHSMTRIQDSSSGIMAQASYLTSSSNPQLISATTSTAQHSSESWSGVAPISPKGTSATATTAPPTDSSSGVVTQSYSTTTNTTAPQLSESTSGATSQLNKESSSDQMVTTSSSTDYHQAKQPFSSPERSGVTATTDPISDDISYDESVKKKKPVRSMSSKVRSSSKYDAFDEEEDDDSLASYLLMSDNPFGDDSLANASTSLLLGDFDPTVKSVSYDANDGFSYWKGYTKTVNAVPTEYAQLVIMKNPSASKDEVEAERARMAMFSLEDQNTWTYDEDVKTGDAIFPDLEEDSSGLSEDTPSEGVSIGKWYKHKNDSMVDSFNFSFVSSLETVETNMTSHADQPHPSESGEILERTNTYKSCSQSTIKTTSWDDVVHPQVRITFSDIEDLTDDSKEFDEIQEHLDVHNLRENDSVTAFLLATPSGMQEFRTGQTEARITGDFGNLNYDDDKIKGGSKRNASEGLCGYILCCVFDDTKDCEETSNGKSTSHPNIQEDNMPFLENESKSSIPTYYEFKSNTPSSVTDRRFESGSKPVKDEAKETSVFGYSTPPEALSLASHATSKKAEVLPTCIAITSPSADRTNLKDDFSSVGNPPSKRKHAGDASALLCPDVANRESLDSGDVHETHKSKSSEMNEFQQCIHFCCGTSFEVSGEEENISLSSKNAIINSDQVSLLEVPSPPPSRDDRSSDYNSSFSKDSMVGYMTPSEFGESQKSFISSPQSKISRTTSLTATPTHGVDLIDMELLFKHRRSTPRSVYTSDSSTDDDEETEIDLRSLASTGVKSISDLLLSDLH